MTLREMVDLASPQKIKIPEFLEFFEVQNVDDFCRYAIVKYMHTEKFQDDLETCLLDYEEAIYKPFSKSWLELTRNPFNDEFTIGMRFGGWNLP